MLRNFSIAVLVWFACVVDLGWAAWTNLSVAPAALDLVLVVTALFLKPRGILFWAGLAGVFASVVHAQPIHLCLPLYSTVALLAAFSQPSGLKRATLTRTAFRSLSILVMLGLGKAAFEEFPSLGFIESIGLEQLAQVAFSFLISITFCLLFLRLHRRSAWD